MHIYISFIAEEFVFVEGIYIGEYPQCGLCGECFDNWGHKIDDVGLALQEQYSRLMTIWTHYDNLTVADVMPMLDQNANDLAMTDQSIEAVQMMIEDLNYLSEGFANVSVCQSIIQFMIP